MTDKLLAYRKEFPILERTTYLVSNSLGPMPRSVPAKLAEYANDWGSLGVKAWTRGWWEKPLDVGNEIATLMNAGAGEVVMMPNVTIAQSAVCSAIDFTAPRDTIVMTELDFPSVRYAYAELAKRFGARLVVVRSEDGISIDHDRLIAAIDERTRLVAISHVLFKSAFINDVDAICAHAHRMGALVSLDAFHSVGIIPVDVKKSGVDFLTGGVLKWLCGGPGGCFLYVSPGIRDTLAPAITGWQAHARPFAFEEGMEYAAGAFRWLNGTPVIPALYACAEGAKIIQSAGVDAIRAKSVEQTARLIELADARGYRVVAPRDEARRGGTVAIDVPHGYEVTQVLLSREIIVDYRVGAGIRVAPFFFTRDDELETLIAAIDEALASSSWEQFAGRTSVVT
ncbi:MAG TPA: aminotransferase class V-fold PLP-dependent enzyme [Gemmatimonadaceae bacterium]|nr:aminotransferase class V-fold PLP-dependent enzyme [Gemmatimonadaceae bacterium]